MRVSVVATGIDAIEVNTEIPRPRRGMAQPLTQTVSAEAPAPAAEARPAPAPEPVTQPAAATQASPAPVAARAAAPRAPEPTFFEDLDVERTAASEQMDDIFAEDVQQDDDLPPPAYQPRVAQFQPQQDRFEDEAENFVAPRAPAPGTPSPEALARLQHAVNKAAPQTQRPVAQPQQEPEQRARFGINSLINRMTGHAAEAQDRPAAQPARQQPPVRAQAPQGYAQQARTNPAEAQDPDQERIEIPAFLRRQAN